MGEAVAAISAYENVLSRPSSEVIVELEHYARSLQRWQRVQNLVSRETLTELWTRHVGDSLQLLKRLDDDDRRFVDLGSGGGLPAIPLAIARKGRGRFLLVEPNGRKAAFLRSVIRELALDATVTEDRAESLDSRETGVPDVISSRALASLGSLCAYSVSLFGPRTRAIFHKGREYGEELSEARVRWDFDVVVVASETSSDGVLLELRNLRAKSAA